MTDRLHITLAQINPVVGDLPYNADKVRAVWKDAAQADLIVFPESVLSGYPPEDLVLKPFFMDKIEELVEALAKESIHHAPWILLTAPWRRNGQLHNAVHVIGSGKVQSTRTKVHLPNYGVFDEQRVFIPGLLPNPVSVKGYRLGVMICEDMWFPDVAEHLKRMGAEILIVPNGSPYETDKRDTRFLQAGARVNETGLPLIYVNQVGGQDELVFDGASFVLDETGRLVLQGEEFSEGLYHTLWERNAGGHWLCIANTMHSTPEDSESMYAALTLGLRDYVVKNGFKGVLLGLSGGIDSALSAAIAVDALGPKAVHCVMMPSPYTSDQSLNDAAACAKALGCPLETVSIKPAMKAYHSMLKKLVRKGAPPETFENIQSRSRGMALMALSNATGYMVLSTGNKSEMAVGYATLYGDMCGGFNALKDLYKTQVYTLSHWRNANKPKHGFGPQGIVIPEPILTRPPTAELKKNQTDQDTLPPYDVLDGILEGLIEHDLGIEEIAARGYDRQTVARVWKMLDRAEYKRRQAAPGVKITSRAFGRDRRYPITNRFHLNIGDKL